ncbi:MAG: hypothetical protein ACOC3I_02440 [Verrucomicrobiota bacterium]
MKTRLLCCLVLALFGVSAFAAAPPLRNFPDGTRLPNDLVTPIYVDALEIRDDAGSLGLRLKDSSSFVTTLYAIRGKRTTEDGEREDTLQLSLREAPGKEGADLIEAASSRERHYLWALRNALDHYAPGWTTDWAMDKHRALKQLVEDLDARQRTREAAN